MTRDVLLAAAGAEYSIPLGALIVSVAALVYGMSRGKSGTVGEIEKAMNDRIADLLEQLASAKIDNLECARRCDDLRTENIDLMRRLVRLENGGHRGGV